jgi:hypothetical protein
MRFLPALRAAESLLRLCGQFSGVFDDSYVFEKTPPPVLFASESRTAARVDGDAAGPLTTGADINRVCAAERSKSVRSVKCGRHPMSGGFCVLKHGYTSKKSPKYATYQVWGSLRQRCLNPKSLAFDNYGGRGISVCARWDSFENFLADMGEKPEGMQLDRIDNDGNYEPSNCRWATREVQARNRSSNRLLTLNGKTQCMQEWADELGIGYSALKWQIRTGRTLEQAIEACKSAKDPAYRGVSQTKEGNWRATFNLRGETHHVGTFSDREIAASALREARAKAIGTQP